MYGSTRGEDIAELPSTMPKRRAECFVNCMEKVQSSVRLSINLECLKRKKRGEKI